LKLAGSIGRFCTLRHNSHIPAARPVAKGDRKPGKSIPLASRGSRQLGRRAKYFGDLAPDGWFLGYNNFIWLAAKVDKLQIDHNAFRRLPLLWSSKRYNAAWFSRAGAPAFSTPYNIGAVIQLQRSNKNAVNNKR